MKSNKSILLVEDDPNFGRILKDYLTINNYDVSLAVNGIEGFEKFNRSEFDLCILDIMMPFKDGLTLAREIREVNDAIPLIFLTAKNLKDDVLKGYKIGADDYLTKPISLVHLAARVTALFQRIEALSGDQDTINDVTCLGELELDVARLTCHWAGDSVDLTLTEFWMVASLVRRPGHVKDRDQLMQEAQLFVDENTVTSHIKRIRKKFKSLDPGFDRIDTVYGMGYRWRDD